MLKNKETIKHDCLLPEFAEYTGTKDYGRLYFKKIDKGNYSKIMNFFPEGAVSALGLMGR